MFRATWIAGVDQGFCERCSGDATEGTLVSRGLRTHTNARKGFQSNPINHPVDQTTSKTEQHITRYVTNH